MKRRVKNMLDYEIQKFDGSRLGHWKHDMEDKLLWLYLSGGMSKRKYNAYLCKITDKYNEAHENIFGY
ncbi:MAG: hypothetical protein QXI16_03505 [Sulfolobaceae archaeon]